MPVFNQILLVGPLPDSLVLALVGWYLALSLLAFLVFALPSDYTGMSLFPGARWAPVRARQPIRPRAAGANAAPCRRVGLELEKASASPETSEPPARSTRHARGQATPLHSTMNPNASLAAGRTSD